MTMVVCMHQCVCKPGNSPYDYVEYNNVCKYNLYVECKTTPALLYTSVLSKVLWVQNNLNRYITDRERQECNYDDNFIHPSDEYKV